MPESSPEVVAVQKLAAKMKYKMRQRKHSHAIHWHAMQPEELMNCIYMETHELSMALIELHRESDYYARRIRYDDKKVIRARRKVISECADVANYCAFIVDNLTRGGKA